MAAAVRAALPTLTPDDFREHHMRTNTPVILGGLTDGWRAAAEWRVANSAAQSAAAAGVSSVSSAAVPSRAAATDPTAVHQLLLHAKRVVLASITKRDGGAAAAAVSSPATSSSPTPAAAAAATAAPPLFSFQLPPPPSTPNFARLRQLFATRADGQPHMVSVAQCFGRSDSGQLEGEGSDVQQSQQQAAADGSCARQSMDSFLRDWERLVADRAAQHSSPTPVDRRRLRYLKDWHLVLTHPHYDAYLPPPHFADDWMNSAVRDQAADGHESVAEAAARAPGEGPDDEAMSDDDFRFCYAGPAGTWTPMHSDVYNSYSWSANVVGRKLWVIFAPEWRPILTKHGQLVHDVLAIESCDPNQLALPLDLLMQSASRDGEDDVASESPAASPSLPACLVWIQQEGETIFVPSGWLHQVHNLDDCVSINHNWMNACNLPNMYAFLTGEWTAALTAVQGFDFDSGPGAPASDAPSSHVAAADLDAITLGNAWRVMAANVGMSWSQFAHFLRFHRARLQRMRAESLQLRSSEASTSPPPSALSLEVLDFSLERIDQVEESMRADGVDAIMARWRQLQEAEAAASIDPVEQLEQQFSRAQVSGNAGEDAVQSESSDVSSSDAESSSEEEFVPRHLRPNEGQKRRTRIIRDDSDEVESDPDPEEEYDPRAQDEEDAADAVSDSSSSSTDGSVSSARRSPQRLPSHPPLHCTCPVHPAAATAAAAAAAGAEPDENGFSVASTLSYMLRLFFQDVHAAVDLPFMPSLPLDLIASYATTTAFATAAAGAVPPAAAASSSLYSAASSSSAHPSPPRRVGRGPFLVVLTHYAHGDTFSETYADESELLRGMRAYAAAAMVRALEAELEGSDEADLKRAITMLQRLLAQTTPGQHALLEGADAPASSSVSAPAPSSPSVPPASASAPPRSTLDVLMELAMDIGDELIQSQLGYGWTLVHECGVDD